MKLYNENDISVINPYVVEKMRDFVGEDIDYAVGVIVDKILNDKLVKPHDVAFSITSFASKLLTGGDELAFEARIMDIVSSMIPRKYLRQEMVTDEFCDYLYNKYGGA